MLACESLRALLYPISDHKQGYAGGSRSNLHEHISWCSRLYAHDRNEAEACLRKAREGSGRRSCVGSTVRYHQPVGFGRAGVRRGCETGVDAKVPAVP
jgi:hypothetical protein